MALSATSCSTNPASDDDTGDDDTCDTEPAEVGIYHRATADVCPDTREAVTPVPPECSDYPEAACHSHEDCTEGPNGRCTVGVWGTQDCGCTYDECFTDADCDEDELCGCGEAEPFANHFNNMCISAACRTDGDCEEGYCFAVPYYCDAPSSQDDLWIQGFACATADDECRNHEVCACGDELARCMPESHGDPWTCGRGYMWDCD